ncbi:SDR family NAD(P)-dependent oxidoreductase [Bacillus sp. 2205SS5-2]|uniref:SDR family NAD(P)-dependent oxidoreductase n=1 Tax=Bacillus sp. 2205SS5-2 TaxID=3109031 RepID=UPI00300414B0
MYLSSFNLHGKNAVVTGAGRGIGQAVAIGLAEAGANVILVSRTKANLEETAIHIKNQNVSYWVMPTDVTSEKAVESLFKRIDEEVGSVDILINNAGMNIRSKALDVTTEEWNIIMDTNLKSAFQMAQKAGERMQKLGHGKIVNISSVGGHVALRTGVVYAMTKAALIQMTKVLALEWGEHNINVNAIGPWYFPTPLTEKLLQDENYVEDILRVTPLNRLGKLEELVSPTVFLCSEAGNYITGQTLFVDGGMTIQGF